MHPLYIKSISTLPILFVLFFPFCQGNASFFCKAQNIQKHTTELNYMFVLTHKLHREFKVNCFPFFCFIALFVSEDRKALNRDICYLFALLWQDAGGKKTEQCSFFYFFLWFLHPKKPKKKGCCSLWTKLNKTFDAWSKCGWIYTLHLLSLTYFWGFAV